MNNKNIIRRGQFCQIVGEIKGSHEYLIVGIDGDVGGDVGSERA